MASRETNRACKAGLGYDIANKIAANRDGGQEEEVAAWIAAVSSQSKPDSELYDNWLKDGQVLCNLLNAIHPGSVKKVKKMGGAFAFMENITNFLSCIKNMGVAVEDSFQTVDLWEKMNIASVTNTLYAFSRVLQKTHSSLPPLGPAI